MRSVPSSEAHGLGNLRTGNTPERAGWVFQALAIPHRCTPFDLSNCSRAQQELRQDAAHLFQRARVLRGNLVSCSCCPPEFLQSTDSVVEKGAEQFDFASAERSTPVYNRVWSTFQLACSLTQGGENRVSHSQGRAFLPR